MDAEYDAAFEADRRQRRSWLGIVGFVLAICATVLSCLPQTFMIGWMLLSVAFVVGLVAVFIPDTVKWPAIAAMVGSFVGVGRHRVRRDSVAQQ